MRAIAIILTFAVSIWISPELNADVLFLGYFDGGKWHAGQIADKETENSPNWSGKGNPPFSLEKAIEVSANRLPVDKANALRWELHSAQLLNVTGRKWYWLLSYHQEPNPGVGIQGVAGRRTLAVLMTGRVIEPSVIVTGNEKELQSNPRFWK